MDNYFTEQNDRNEWLVYKSQRDGSSLLIIAFASRIAAQRCVKWLADGRALASFLKRGLQNVSSRLPQ